MTAHLTSSTVRLYQAAHCAVTALGENEKPYSGKFQLNLTSPYVVSLTTLSCAAHSPLVHYKLRIQEVESLPYTTLENSHLTNELNIIEARDWLRLN